jgi:hypothetical protein
VRLLPYSFSSVRAFCVAAALLLAAGAAPAQDYGHQAPWDDDGNSGGQVFSRGNFQLGPLRVRTSRPTCLLSAGFPVVRALVEPSEAVTGVSLHFRPEGYALWYQVPMKRSGEGFLAMMPKPRPSARRVHFYVQVTTLEGGPQRGNELSARVVERSEECEGALAETSERAAIAVRVPKGAPAVPPVPPGFEPVGTVNLDPPRRSGGKAPLYVAGGFAGAVGAVFAANKGPVPSASTPSQNQISYLDSNPPPDSHLSLSAAPQLQVRMRVRLGGPLGAGAGVVRITLLRSTSGNAPCAVVEMPLPVFLQAGVTQEVAVSGVLTQAVVCQPADRLRMQILQNNTVVAGTGDGGAPDAPARYFLDP